ncbi:MAG: alpha/beta hydrolase [Paracoccaceae bacterium]|nr:alpha/beta hydrolase [Paracoccaceae bacterium]
MLNKLVCLLLVCGLAACAPANSVTTTIGLMEPPVLYQGGDINPFPANLPADRQIPYATQRVPAIVGDALTYTDEPETILRVGHVDVAISGIDGSLQISDSLLPAQDRMPALFVDVRSIDEAGPLVASRHPAANPALFAPDAVSADRAFAARINKQLAATRGGDLVIYVHGVRSDFSNPVLAAAELQHFAGYRNVFSAYAWPAESSLISYLQDTEEATGSAFLFRRYIRFLAAETNARRIHIVAHSAGTRLVTEAIGQFGLEYSRASDAQIKRDLKLGKVILIGSDASPDRFGSYLIDGADRIIDELTIYTSTRDRALRLSDALFGLGGRLGQTTTTALPDYVQTWLESIEDLNIIDVTDAEASNAANGHGYLRGSPWVSSDIVTSINFDLTPAERGLVRAPVGPGWVFPPDYPSKLRSAVRRADPGLVR